METLFSREALKDSLQTKFVFLALSLPRPCQAKCSHIPRVMYVWGGLFVCLFSFFLSFSIQNGKEFSGFVYNIIIYFQVIVCLSSFWSQ